MPHSATRAVPPGCRSADVRHGGPDGALQPSYWSWLVSACLQRLLRLQRAVVAWACGVSRWFLALSTVNTRTIGDGRSFDAPGNSHRSARPHCLHLSHGGRSSWMHFCFADLQDTHATGLRMVAMPSNVGEAKHRRVRDDPASVALPRRDLLSASRACPTFALGRPSPSQQHLNLVRISFFLLHIVHIWPSRTPGLSETNIRHEKSQEGTTLDINQCGVVATASLQPPCHTAFIGLVCGPWGSLSKLSPLRFAIKTVVLSCFPHASPISKSSSLRPYIEYVF